MSRHVLFMVDDDEDDRLFIQESLNMPGDRQIELFSDGTSLLNTLEHLEHDELPQMIVTDLNMPGMNGYDLLEALKSNKQFGHIPVVVFSTSRNALNRERCLRAGAAQYQVKPNSFTEFATVIRSLLARAQSKMAY